jgi:hypothetical protein
MITPISRSSPVAAKLVFALVLCLLWGIAVGAGMVWLSRYSGTPGLSATPPEQWPARADALPRGQYTLVMAAHPQCPCTRASLDELAIVMAESKGRMAAAVLFLAPVDERPDWWETSLWHKAAEIPGVTPVVDRGGVLQHVFGALTSGSVAVYDSSNHLRFSGGLTAARGHAGINAGRLSVMALLDAKQRVATAITPVFGCSLTGPTIGGQDRRGGGEDGAP